MSAWQEAWKALTAAFAPRGLALAAGSGLAATVAIYLSPVGAQYPVVQLPWLPLDIAPLLPTLLFVLLHAFAWWSKWPFPALMLPGLAMSFAVLSHFQASALLNLVPGFFEGSAPGQRVDLGRTFASGASLLLALAATLDRGHERLHAMVRDAGVEEERLAVLDHAAEGHAYRTLAFAGAAFVAFTLAASVGDALVGGEQAPLPEVLGALLAVGVALLLFPGMAFRPRPRDRA